MLACYPQADLFCIVDFMTQRHRGFLQGTRITTSFIQNLPFAKTRYRQYLLFMPLAVEQFDLSAYDLVISSSHAVAKGVLTGPDQLHLCMCYSPMRYAWDLHHMHLRQAGLDQGLTGWAAKYVLHKMRIWDARTAAGVDEFAAISHFVARRIWKTYRRRSQVIYPPVEGTRFVPGNIKDDFYFTASRMVPYKRLDVIVEAFNHLPEKKLFVAGDGPEFHRIKNLSGRNIQLLGFQPQDRLIDYMQRARAFVFAAEEDFGIAPLEAQACGTPVIAFGKGGAKETLHGLEDEHPDAVFFEEQSAASLIGAVSLFEREAALFDPARIRDNALQFSVARFKESFVTFVEQALRTRRPPL